MNGSVLTIGTLSLAGMVTTALFVVPMVGDNVAEKAAKRDEDTPALVLASTDDNGNDDADDIFGARITSGTNNDAATAGTNTGTNTGGATTSAGTDTGTGGVNRGPGNAEDGHHADRSGPSGADNSGSGNADDPMTMGDDSGGDDSGGDDSGGGSGRG
jgi:hypothetical protein